MKVFLAYAGGLETSVIVHWLRQRYGAEVVTYAGAVGQGAARLTAEAAERRASHRGTAS